MITEGTVNITEVDLSGDIDNTRKLVRQYERRNIEGAVFIELRVDAQLAGAAATAMIRSCPFTREEFLRSAARAYDLTAVAFKLRVDQVVDEREAARNPPEPVPPIVDVG